MRGAEPGEDRVEQPRRPLAAVEFRETGPVCGDEDSLCLCRVQELGQSIREAIHRERLKPHPAQFPAGPGAHHGTVRKRAKIEACARQAACPPESGQPVEESVCRRIRGLTLATPKPGD